MAHAVNVQPAEFSGEEEDNNHHECTNLGTILPQHMVPYAVNPFPLTGPFLQAAHSRNNYFLLR
jgi:hypothetical protein